VIEKVWHELNDELRRIGVRRQVLQVACVKGLTSEKKDEMSRLESDVFRFSTTTASKKTLRFLTSSKNDWKPLILLQRLFKKLKNTFKKMYSVNIYVLTWI
jgi:hypothetical protein